MTEGTEIERLIQKIKKDLAEKRDAIQDIETLIGEKAEDLWGLGEKPLEKAAWRSFLTLEKNKDCLDEEPITSGRRLFGPIIILFKKILRSLTRPYTRMILQRQSRFDRELVHLQLAVLLRLEKIKERVDSLEGQAAPSSRDGLA